MKMTVVEWKDLSQRMETNVISFNEDDCFGMKTTVISKKEYDFYGNQPTLVSLNEDDC